MDDFAVAIPRSAWHSAVTTDMTIL